MGKYDSIIHLPHKQSSKRPHMPVHDRAAQFASFAALTGYEDEVAETARLTEQQIQLTEEQTELLDQRLSFLKKEIDKQPPVKIIYFVADDKKDGGIYQEVSGVLKRINEYERTVELLSGDIIPMETILSIETA